MIRALLVAAVLSTAAPAVLAQDAPAAPAAPEAPAAEAPAPGEAEFEAAAQAFGLSVQAMAQEMQTAVTNAAGDAAKQDADLDAIEARYQADTEAFASALETFVGQKTAAAPESERAGMAAELAEALPQIRSYPQMVRAQIEQAATPAPTPAPTTPPAS